MKGKFINPFTDVGFKRIFGSEESKSVLIYLLNTVIGDENRIVSIEYTDKEHPSESTEGKTVIYDIYCKTIDGRRIIVEMQGERQHNFKKRTLYYVARSISRQIMKGETDYEYDAVYLVSLLNFSDRSISDDIRTEVRLMDMKHKRAFMNEMRLIYVQLPLMKKTEEECDNDLDYWIYILNNMETLDKMPFTDKNPAFVELIDLATYQNMSEDEQVAYDRSLKRMWDYDNMLRGEREYAMAEGEARGEARGRAEGRAEGEARGRAEGEAMEKAKIAKNLKGLAVPIEIIVQASGLTKEQIEEL